MNYRGLLVFGVSCVIWLNTMAARSQIASNGANEGADWNALHAVDQRAGGIKDADPETALKTYQKFFIDHPNLHPVVGCTVCRNMAIIYAEQLKDAAKAAEVYTWAYQKYNASPALVIVLEENAIDLIAQNHPEEAVKLFDANHKLWMAAGQSHHPYLLMFASRSLNQYATAMEKLKQDTELISVLQKDLVEIPAFLDDRNQGSDGWLNGWVFEKIVQKLSEAKRDDEALQWAKLYFTVCAFDKDSISHATRTLARCWADREDFADIQALAQAQQDRTKANPLAAVKLPGLGTEALKAQLTRLGANQGFNQTKAPEIIGLLIASGATREAMTEARQLLVTAPESTEGVTQICRVFKAADLSVDRANSFLQYINGKGPNPLPDFFKGQAANAPAKAGNPAAAGNAPLQPTTATTLPANPTQPHTPAPGG